MATVRKIKVYQFRLTSGRELLLEEGEAIEVGDQLVARALVGADNQRRLAAGDVALDNLRMSMQISPRLTARKKAA